MNRKKIPTPKFVGIIDVYNPDFMEETPGLVMEIKTDCILIKIIEFNSSSRIGLTFTSDNFEIVLNKENRIISEDSLESKFCERIKQSICDTLNLMIINLKIPKQDLVKKLKEVDFQGLYSYSQKFFYLIDFEEWKTLL